MSCKDCEKGHCDEWDHLVERVRHQWDPLLEQIGEMVGIGGPHRMVEFVEPSAVVVGPRCQCGGVFKPNLTGKMTCNCCEALMTVGDVGASASADGAWSDVGKTLAEVLAHRRMEAARRSRAWEPRDEDVRVSLANPLD